MADDYPILLSGGQRAAGNTSDVDWNNLKRQYPAYSDHFDYARSIGFKPSDMESAVVRKMGKVRNAAIDAYMKAGESPTAAMKKADLGLQKRLGNNDDYETWAGRWSQPVGDAYRVGVKAAQNQAELPAWALASGLHGLFSGRSDPAAVGASDDEPSYPPGMEGMPVYSAPPPKGQTFGVDRDSPQTKIVQNAMVKSGSLGTARPEDVMGQGETPPTTGSRGADMGYGLTGFVGGNPAMAMANPGSDPMDFLATAVGSGAPALTNTDKGASLEQQAGSLAGQTAVNTAGAGALHLLGGALRGSSGNGAVEGAFDSAAKDLSKEMAGPNFQQQTRGQWAQIWPTLSPEAKAMGRTRLQEEDPDLLKFLEPGGAPAQQGDANSPLFDHPVASKVQPGDQVQTPAGAGTVHSVSDSAIEGPQIHVVNADGGEPVPVAADDVEPSESDPTTGSPVTPGDALDQEAEALDQATQRTPEAWRAQNPEGQPLNPTQTTPASQLASQLTSDQKFGRDPQGNVPWSATPFGTTDAVVGKANDIMADPALAAPANPTPAMPADPTAPTLASPLGNPMGPTQPESQPGLFDRLLSEETGGSSTAGTPMMEPDASGKYPGVIPTLKNRFMNTGIGKWLASSKLGTGVDETLRAGVGNYGMDQATLNEKRMAGGGITNAMIQIRSKSDTLMALPAEVRAALNPVIEDPSAWNKVDPAIRDQVFDTVINHLDPILRTINQHQDELVSMGILDKDQIAKDGGQYLRRVYLSRLAGSNEIWKPPADAVNKMEQFLYATAAKEDGTKPTRTEISDDLDRMINGQKPQLVFPGNRKVLSMFTGNLKALQDVPLPVRQFMGEVQDGAYRSLRTLADSTKTVMMARYFRGLSERLPDMLRDTPAGEQVTLSSYRLTDEQKQLLGPLANSLMPRDLADSIHGDFFHDQGGTLKFMESLFGKPVAWMKYKNTVLNPASWVHHFSGLMYGSHWGGNSIFNPRNFGHYVDAIGDVLNTTPELQQAIGDGAHPGGVTMSNEGRQALVEFAKKIAHENMGDEGAIRNAFLGFMQDKFRDIGQARETMDPIFRQAMYRKATGLLGTASKAIDATPLGAAKGVATHDHLGAFLFGGTPGNRVLNGVDAAAHVNDWFPTYNEVSKPLKEAGRIPLLSLTNNPFFRFQVEMATKILPNAISRKPMALTATMLGLYAASHAGAVINGVSDPEFKQLAGQPMPSYDQWPDKTLGFIPLMRDEHNMPLFLDGSHMVPMGPVFHGVHRDPRLSWPDQFMDWSFHAFDNVTGGGLLSGGPKSSEQQSRDRLLYPWYERGAEWAYNSMIAPPPMATTGPLTDMLRIQTNNVQPSTGNPLLDAALAYRLGRDGVPDNNAEEMARLFGFPVHGLDPAAEPRQFQMQMKDLDDAQAAVGHNVATGQFLFPDLEAKWLSGHVADTKKKLGDAEADKRK